MYKKTKLQILSLVMAAILLMGMNPINVYAASPNTVENVEMIILEGGMENPDFYEKGSPNKNSISRDSSYLIGCDISSGFMSYGLHIQLETSTTQVASKLGVKDVKVQEKNGIFWNTITSSDGNYVTNDDWFIGALDCYSAVDGRTYRVKCTHYAYIGGNYYYYDHTTNAFTYVKP